MNHLMCAIVGQEPYDLVIRNIQLVNVCTAEIYPSEIGIRDGKIGHVNQPGDLPLKGNEVYDGKGQYAIPGLIDTHVHIESTMMTPEHLAAAVLPNGTTTIACDPHEIANVLGVEGVRYILDVSRHLPLQVHVLVPSCVPSSIGVETSGAALGKDEIERLLSLEGTKGLGEVMDYPAVIRQDQRMMDILSVAKKHTRFLQGHAPALTGANLSAYMAAGIQSCHETSFVEEARYKLRAGLTLECREGSVAQDLAAIAPVLKEMGYPQTATICTDDREPEDLYKEGHMDHAIRIAIQNGIEPVQAICMATRNAARLLDVQDVGLLVPGRLANLALLPDLDAFCINEVFVQGQLIAKGGKLLQPMDAIDHPIHHKNTIQLHSLPKREDFIIRCSGESARVNCIGYNNDTPLFTSLKKVSIPTMNGALDLSNQPSLAWLAVYERHGKNGNKAIGIVKDLGLTHGAVASTISHDCHNLVVVGRDPADMECAAQALAQCGGGVVCVVEGKILAQLPLPVAGLMSTLPIEKLAPLTAHMNETLHQLGLQHACPIVQMAWFALAVIPDIRLTDKGLLDVRTQQFLPFFAD